MAKTNTKKTTKNLDISAQGIEETTTTLQQAITDYKKAADQGEKALETSLEAICKVAAELEKAYKALEFSGRKNWSKNFPLCAAMDKTKFYKVMGCPGLTDAQNRTLIRFAAKNCGEVLKIGKASGRFGIITIVQEMMAEKPDSEKDKRGRKKGQRRVTANKKKTDNKKETTNENKAVDLSELMAENPHLVIASVFNAWRKHNPKKSGDDFMSFVQDTINNFCTVAGITKKAA